MVLTNLKLIYFKPPNICEGNFDSIGIIDNLLYIIKDDFIWQLNKTFTISSDYPKKVTKVFPNLPKRFKKIDSFYQSPDGGEIVIFAGSEYITYDPRGPIYMAYNLTRYTLDEDILKINAAMVWCKLKFWKLKIIYFLKLSKNDINYNKNNF